VSDHIHMGHGRSCEHACCLKLTDVGVRFGDQEILKGINMHLHCGQIAALIGPNGAGKSTLIKTILGQKPYTGVIDFAMEGHPHQKLRIGYVPQSPNFDPSDPVTVEDLFVSCLTSRPSFLRTRKKLREQILEDLRKVRGEGLLTQRIGLLSGGELQRVLLALALEPMPNLLILDEPLSGVDVEGMELLMEMLHEIRRTCDLSILMVTHDFSMLTRFVDKVFLLDRRILKSGPPLDVLNSEEFAEAFHLGGESE